MSLVCARRRSTSMFVTTSASHLKPPWWHRLCGSRWFVIPAALAVALALAGCAKPGRPKSSAASEFGKVAVQLVERRDVPLVVDLPARMEAAAKVEIRANVQGRLTDMQFKEGVLIRKGQMLFLIDPRRYDAAIEVAAAAVERAEAELELAREQKRLVNAQSALRQAQANLLKADQDVERLRPLAARRAVPARDLDSAVAIQSSAAAAVEDARATVRTTDVVDRMNLRQAQANLTAARAELDTARFDREQTEIRAPVGGLIGAAEKSVGNYLGPMEANRLATISQVDPVDPIRVAFGISEKLV